MGTYIVKRVLLMVPTFFAVSLIVFVVLNFAPGNPAAEALVRGDAQSGQSSELAGQTRESYRLFKEQFNLDKPILFNTRFALDAGDVREAIAVVLQLECRGLASEAECDVEIGDRIEAQEDLENWGWYAVPALVELLQTDPDQAVRAFASQQLVTAAQRPLITHARPLTDEEREHNRTTSRENGRLLGQSFAADDDPAREQEVSDFWGSWRAERGAEWDYGTGDKVAILFGDTRFARYWANLIRLDFGISHRDKKPVLGTVLYKLRYSVTLSLSAVLLMYFISVPLGIWSAVRRNSVGDRLVTMVLFMLYSLPSFFVGVVLLNFLSRGTPLSIFPTSGFESLDVSGMTTLEYIADVAWHVALPVFCLSYAGLAVLSRYARTGLLDVIRSDYVRTARAKGLPEFVVITKHAARNGMIPILTLMATLLPMLIGGSVIVEVVFGIPGMGLFMFESIGARDYNAVMAVLLISCALTLVGMLLSDVSYAIVDPRITFDRARQ